MAEPLFNRVFNRHLAGIFSTLQFATRLVRADGFETGLGPWALIAGSGSVVAQAPDDAASHAPGPYAGVMAIGFGGDGSQVFVSRSYATRPATAYEARIVLSFGGAADRVLIQATRADRSHYWVRAPQGAAGEVVVRFVTAPDAQGQVTHLQLRPFDRDAAADIYMDSAVLRELPAATVALSAVPVGNGEIDVYWTGGAGLLSVTDSGGQTIDVPGATSPARVTGLAAGIGSATVHGVTGRIDVGASIAPEAAADPVIGAAAGWVREGAPATLTPGIWVSVPAPAITRQWRLDGVAVPGATGLSYTPSAGAFGSALDLIETADNGIDPPVAAISAAVTVSRPTIDATGVTADSSEITIDEAA